MSKLQELLKDVVADKVVDSAEAAQMREVVYADGVVDREEANFLFDVNDAVSGNDNCEEYKALFVEAITDHVLADEKTPGVLDEDESTYIIEKIQGDGQVDDLEKALVANIVEKAESVPPAFSAFAASL